MELLAIDIKVIVSPELDSFEVETNDRAKKALKEAFEKDNGVDEQQYMANLLNDILGEIMEQMTKQPTADELSKWIKGLYIDKINAILSRTIVLV